MKTNISESLWTKCGVKSIDHVAVTTTNLFDALNDFLGVQGCELIRGPGTNTAQNVDYAFVRTPQGMTIEILGIRTGSPITEHINNGGGAYHLCYTVIDLNIAEHHAIANGAIKVVEQRQDDAFDGRRVAFFMHPYHGLFEFLEAYPNSLNKQRPTNNSSRLRSVIHTQKENRSSKHIILKAFKTIFPELKDDSAIINAQLDETPNWNSLNQIQLVMVIEKMAKVNFTVKEISSISSYHDFVSALSKKI